MSLLLQMGNKRTTHTHNRLQLDSWITISEISRSLFSLLRTSGHFATFKGWAFFHIDFFQFVSLLGFSSLGKNFIFLVSSDSDMASHTTLKLRYAECCCTVLHKQPYFQKIFINYSPLPSGYTGKKKFFKKAK